MEFNWGDMRSLGIFAVFALISVGLLSISAAPLPDFLNPRQLFESIFGLPENTVGSGPIYMQEIGRYSGSAAEISAYEPISRHLYIAGGEQVQVLDLSNPEKPTLLEGLPYAATGVAAKNGVIALAVPHENKANKGRVYLIDTQASRDPKLIQVGALPDMLAFTPDGTKVVVANEGEPGDKQDPEGSITVIDLSNGISRAKATAISLISFDAQRQQLVNQGVRIFPSAGSVSQDLEPEYVAVSSDGSTAWVTLQENNALAVVDIPSASVTAILPLGAKDHNLPGNGLDASDRDLQINIQNWPVLGLYMPDGIAAYQVDGETYLITANEGDARDEDARIETLTLDPGAFPNAPELQHETAMGRLQVSTIDGDIDSDGDYDRLYAYGGRSFSIWDDRGNQVFDSGDQLERITAQQTPALFNADSGLPTEWDKRSDNKGPEPEGVTTGEIGGRTYAFVGLERAGGGILIYDVSDPANPEFIQYARSDVYIAPEGLLFVAAEDSPSGKPLLIVSNEVSATVTIYEIRETVPSLAD